MDSVWVCVDVRWLHHALGASIAGSGGWWPPAARWDPAEVGQGLAGVKEGLAELNGKFKDGGMDRLSGKLDLALERVLKLGQRVRDLEAAMGSDCSDYSDCDYDCSLEGDGDGYGYGSGDHVLDRQTEESTCGPERSELVQAGGWRRQRAAQQAKRSMHEDDSTDGDMPNLVNAFADQKSAGAAKDAEDTRRTKDTRDKFDDLLARLGGSMVHGPKTDSHCHHVEEPKEDTKGKRNTKDTKDTKDKYEKDFKQSELERGRKEGKGGGVKKKADMRYMDKYQEKDKTDMKSEGIFLGDIADVASVRDAMQGVDKPDAATEFEAW